MCSNRLNFEWTNHFKQMGRVKKIFNYFNSPSSFPNHQQTYLIPNYNYKDGCKCSLPLGTEKKDINGAPCAYLQRYCTWGVDDVLL